MEIRPGPGPQANTEKTLQKNGILSVFLSSLPVNFFIFLFKQDKLY